MPTPVADLEAFARHCIAAERHPRDYHLFRLFTCDACGASAFAVSIEHHSGSKKGSFKGLILGECGARKRLFSFTGEHRQRLREDSSRCECGHDCLVVGECERFWRKPRKADAAMASSFLAGPDGDRRRTARNSGQPASACRAGAPDC